MKTIFLCEDEKNIRNVYGADDTVFCKADVLNHPEQFADTECIFSTWGMPVFTGDEIKACLPALKAVFYGAGSVQFFARPFLACGVRVFSAWAANAVPVAEYTAAQIILANKGFFACSRIAKTGDYSAAAERFAAYPGNYGAKVGIIGAGKVGSLVIKLLAAYDVEVLVFDPFLPEERARELGAKKCALQTLFEECRVISNHLANNAGTVGMLDGALFKRMPPYATFLNTGRGAQVVEDELADVLRARPDLTAVLDVTFPEPPLKGSALYKLENCVLTPHIAGSSGSEVRRMGEYMLEEYERFAMGQPCRYEVTEEMLATMA